MNIFRNTSAFVVAYLLLMLPTYILPYLGSNSSLLNTISVGAGFGFPPQWWAHVWSLVMLAMITWVRGHWIGKNHLPIFAVLAGAFDMLPFLSMIPLAPTVLHVVALVVGSNSGAADESKTEIGAVVARKALKGAGAMTLAAVAGSILFATSAHKKSVDFEMARESKKVSAVMKQTQPVKKIEKEQVLPSVDQVPVATKMEVKPSEQPQVENHQAVTTVKQTVTYNPPPAGQNKATSTTSRDAKKGQVEFTTLDKANAEIDRLLGSGQR